MSMSTFSSTTSLSTKKSTQDIAKERERFRALEKHRRAMFILTQKDRPIPSLQEMQEDLKKDELSSIKDRIATTKMDFKNDLERLFTEHAEEYLDDQRLRRESREDYSGASDGQSGGLSRLVEWSAKRDPLASRDHHYEYSLCSHLTSTLSTQNSHLHALYVQKSTIEKRLEEERRQRDAAFPLTLIEFYNKARDVQIRVARFLCGDSVTKERMMTEFSWAWRQVNGLVREFENNEEFEDNVFKLLETLESKDPRKKKPTLP